MDLEKKINEFYSKQDVQQLSTSHARTSPELGAPRTPVSPQDIPCLTDDCSGNRDITHDSTQTQSNEIESLYYPKSFKQKGIELYGTISGPCFYNVPEETATPPLIMEHLPAAFDGLPVTGRPDSRDKLAEFQKSELKKYVGEHLSSSEFDKIAEYCSCDHLKTDKDLVMPTNVPSFGLFPNSEDPLRRGSEAVGDLYINKALKNKEHDGLRYLKYRGVRIIPPPKEDEASPSTDEMLEPGKDIILKVRIYRPFPSSLYKKGAARAGSLQCEVAACGRTRLWQLRDRVLCANDLALRVDEAPPAPPAPPAPAAPSTARDLFPSAFMCIGNELFVDARAGCRDLTAPLRRWARARGLPCAPPRSMDEPLHRLRLRLGHPEVLVHQGGCEHVLTFSAARLARGADPPARSLPRAAALAALQTVYCTACAEFAAKWLVAGCARVPFDPAYFCDACLNLYLYKDGRKVGDFKAYAYRGNEIDVVTPVLS